MKEEVSVQFDKGREAIWGMFQSFVIAGINMAFVEGERGSSIMLKGLLERLLKGLEGGVLDGSILGGDAGSW